MRIVIKLGEAMFKQEELFSCAISAFVALATEHEIAIVHDGAGTVQQIASDLGRRGMSLCSEIPDSDLRALAAMITGHRNKEIVAAFAWVGPSAAGICGSDGLSFRARKGTVNGYQEA